MSAWTSAELERIAEADELELRSTRHDGTLREPVTIWVIRHGDDLYVRAFHGRGGTWFRGVQDRHAGHIRAGGVDKDVVLVETDKANDEIDAAYRSKYQRYGARYVDPMLAPKARATTLKVVPNG